MFGGLGGGSSSGGFGGLFGGGGSDIPKGYKTHTVITAIRQDTIYFNSDMSYSDSSGFNMMQMIMGGSGDEVTAYKGRTVNLVPALKTLNLNGSGITDNDYISVIDIPEMTELVSGDFSGMTQLEYITLPAGETLTTLDLTGDTALLALDLSDTRGFIFPEGFKTLTGLAKFRMSNRPEIDSIDLSPFTRLTDLEMMNDSLGDELELDGNMYLQKLNVANNEILSLDLSGHTTLTNIDVRNNCLTYIALARNTGIHVNLHSAENSAASLSAQLRVMDGHRRKIFDFRDAGIQPIDFANIVVDSIKGDGVNALAFDPQAGTAIFESYPSVITYDYASGVYYEGSSEPVCMNVRLLWDISGENPLISPVSAEIIGNVDSAVTPVIITADSYGPVTWTTSPAELPAGLEKHADGWRLVISGTPDEEYSGNVIVTAKNENGESESAVVYVEIAHALSERTLYVSPLFVEITVSADSDPIAPVIISADSESPVTWTTIPETLPAGLERTINGDVFIISGKPNSAFSGNVIVTATNENGESESAVVCFDITSEPLQPVMYSSSSGGCNAGFGVMVLACLVLAVKKH